MVPRGAERFTLGADSVRHRGNASPVRLFDEQFSYKPPLTVSARHAALEAALLDQPAWRGLLRVEEIELDERDVPAN